MKTLKQRMLTGIFAASLMGASTIAYAAPVDYVIDTKGMHASINFKIQHLGYSWLRGDFERFSGDFSYDKEDISQSKIKVVIDTASVNSNHAERDKHLRSDDFLNVAKFKQAQFVSTKVSGTDKAMTIEGNFTLNGVTKPLTIQAQKIGEGKDPWGGYRSGFSGTTEFKLADYGISKNLGPASTTVYLELEIEGIRK